MKFFAFFVTLQLWITISFAATFSNIQLSDSLIKPETTRSKYTFKSFRKDFTVPIVLIGLGILSTTDNEILNDQDVYNWRNDHHPNFQNHADNFLRYAPVILTAGIHLFDKQAGNNWGMQGKLLAKSIIFMNALVIPLKALTNVQRPDSSNNHSFPSGHTAVAFMGAEFLRKEYGKEYPLIAVGGYAIATSVGAFRILNNKHWLSDVLVGAGVGIASVQLAYLITPKSKLRDESVLSITPAYFSNGPGFSLVYKLNQSSRRVIY